MPSIVKHRKTQIVILDEGETIQGQCSPGDIAIMKNSEGWWTYFVSDNGEIDSYEAPFDSYNKALWTAKAAAEFDAAEE